MDTMTAEVERKARRERGSGSIYRPKYRDRKTGELRECGTLWIKYPRNGGCVRENTHSDKITFARGILTKRLGEIATGNWTPPKTKKILVSEFVDSLLCDYRNNGRRSLEMVENRWKNHLKPFFGQMRAADVGTDCLDRYIALRRDGKAENATINREMAILHRAFSLAYRSRPRKVTEIPPFPRLKENSPRVGFVDDAQYKKLCDNCKDSWLRSMLGLAYAFGFRKGELLNLRVCQVDLLDRTLRLDAGTTKNGEGRAVKLTSETYSLLCQCVLRKQPDDFVFTWSDGRPVKDFRVSWENLITSAELPGLLFHDLRRSAVRNMIRRGVPQVVAQRISGHKTVAIFNRYNIVSEADLEDAAAKIESRKNAFDFDHTLTNPSQNQQKSAN